MTASEEHRDGWLIVSIKRLLGGGSLCRRCRSCRKPQKSKYFSNASTFVHSKIYSRHWQRGAMRKVQRSVGVQRRDIFFHDLSSDNCGCTGSRQAGRLAN